MAAMFAFNAAVLAASSSLAHVHETAITVGSTTVDKCDPYSWKDYLITVDESLVNANLLFELYGTDTPFDPTALSVSMWEDEVPLDRHAEHKTERANGKLWAVGMNNNCFKIGVVTLGVKCGPTEVNYELKVIEVSAVLIPDAAVHGEVCPDEWVYHYFNTSTTMHFGPGNNLRYTLTMDEGGGVGNIVMKHLQAPIKKVPPYFQLRSESAALTQVVDMCNVEEGRMYLGLLGEASVAGCFSYDVTVEEWMDNATHVCSEDIHAEAIDPATLADRTLPVDHMERASCEPYEWFDFYFPVDSHMLDEQDNFVFEVEQLSDQAEDNTLSVHLFSETIPDHRTTEIVTSTPSDGIYSLAIPSNELRAISYYLSIKCGPTRERFRTAAFLIRGKLLGPADAVHGELCPNEWIYHSLALDGASSGSGSSSSSSSSASSSTASSSSASSSAASSSSSSRAPPNGTG